MSEMEKRLDRYAMTSATLASKATNRYPAMPIARASLLARIQYPIVAGLLLIFLVVGWQGRVPAMRTAGDDEFKYIALSKSLESGSYREIYRPGAPLHVQYPPAYPAWLVVVRRSLGESLNVIRVTNLLLTALVFVLWFLVARRLGGVGLAVGFLLLLVLNRGLLNVGGSLASESLFLVFSTAALTLTLLADRLGTRGLLGVVGLGLLAFLTRSIGLTLMLAIGVWLWSRQSRKALLAWAVTGVLIGGGWFAYTILASDKVTVRSYANEFVGITSAPGTRSALRVLASRVWQHGTAYGTTEMPYLLSLPSLPGTVVDNWAWLAGSIVLLTAGFLVFWRSWRPAAVYLVGYVGLLLIWPFQDGRLLIPILPLGLLAILLGGRLLTGRLPNVAGRLAFGTLLGLMLIGAGIGAKRWHARFQACDRARPYQSAGCYDPARLALASAAEYLRAHAAPQEVVLTREPASLNYLSGLHAEPTHLMARRIEGGPVSALRARNIRFVYVSWPWMAKALESSCRELRLEASYLPAAVLVSTSTFAASDPDACPALREIASRLQAARP